MQDAKTFWNKAAAKYARSPIADMAAYEFTLERTRSYLKPDDRILEIGCGTGSTALLLSKDVATINATDVSDHMIAIGINKTKEQGIKNVEFEVQDILNSEKPKHQFDALLAHNVLHLIEDLPASLKSINRHLKPGGIFISKSVCAFGGGVPIKLRIIKAVLPIMQWMGKAPFVAFRTIEDHEKAIISAGFKIVETGNYPKSPPSRYVVAVKQ